MCGCGSSSNVAQDSVVADAGGTDETMYRVMYFDGQTEDVQGLDAARTLLMNPAARVESAQGLDIGGTYQRI